MSNVAYSTCAIRFSPNDSRPYRDYSDRSIIELLGHSYANYSLRAVDVTNNKQEIFNFKLTKSDEYEFGSSFNNSDTVRRNDGIYSLRLNQEARAQFHAALKSCFEQLKTAKQGSPNIDSGKPSSNNSSNKSPGSRGITEENAILDDIHKLSEYIQNGNEEKAADRTKKLMKKNVRLRVDKSKDLSNEHKFQIQVKIDGIELDIKDKDTTLNVDVYPSTKVHELRALFEHTHDFPCGKQYFFVNGNLAHAESNMKDLGVKDRSLFVLFIPNIFNCDAEIKYSNHILDRMSVAYSTCRIQFIPHDTDDPECTYSERSVVQLLQNDITDYSLRATDVENNNAEIFNFRIEDNDQYEFGILSGQPDEISDENGTYRLWLNQESRSSFHETFRSILEMLFPNEVANSAAESVNESSISLEFDETDEPDIPNPINCDAKNVLTNIRNLSRSIKQGNDDEADRMAKELASQNIRLQVKSLKQVHTEEEFRILVQFDGNEYGIDQNGGTIPVDVFPSTTTRELRAIFELAYNYSPVSQYFFVNGDLVQDNSTMTDLKVGPNSLFVLFLITHPRQFKNTGTWNCSACTMQNQHNTLRCSVCSALRTH